MEFNQLESFVKSAKYLSFSRAAEDLFLSQPSVSLHISNLENELGVKLFSRESKNLSLTEYGEFFLPLAKKILKDREFAKESLYEYIEKNDGSIHIMSSSIPTRYILPDILGIYIKSNSNSSFKIMTSSSKKVCDSLISGKVSLGVVGSKFYTDSIVFEKIFDDEIIFVSSKKTKEIPVTKLKDYKIISREIGSGTRETVENKLKTLGIDINELNTSLVIEDINAICSLVKNNVGITYMSRKNAEQYINNGELYEFKISDFKIQRSFYFAYVKDRVLSKSEETFKKFVKKYSEYLD